MNIAEPGNHDRPIWFTSSYSNGAGGECVECAWTGTGILIRDSKRVGEPACQTNHTLTVSSGAWRAFLGGGLARGPWTP